MRTHTQRYIHTYLPARPRMYVRTDTEHAGIQSTSIYLNLSIEPFLSVYRSYLCKDEYIHAYMLIVVAFGSHLFLAYSLCFGRK